MMSTSAVPPRWRPRFRLWQALVVLVVASSALTIVPRLGLIEFRYVVMDETDPLEQPRQVAAVEDTGEIRLADGQRIRPEGGADVAELRHLVAESENRVDVEPAGMDPDGVLRARIFVRTKAWYGIGGVLG